MGLNDVLLQAVIKDDSERKEREEELYLTMDRKNEMTSKAWHVKIQNDDN